MAAVLKADKPYKQPYNSYLIDQELYVGVSSILNLESPGDFLIPWALRTFSKEPDPLAAHKNYMEVVSGTGTAIHSYIEYDLAGKNPLAFAREDTIAAIEQYHAWKASHKIEILASEKVVHHKEWKCAGTLDAVARIDDKLYVLDYKTGAFKARYFTQLAAYKAMLLNEPKKIRLPEIETAELAVLEIHRDGSEVKLISLKDKYQGMIEEKDELGIFHALRYIWYMRNLKSKQFQPIIKTMEKLLDPMDAQFKKAFNL